jgi:TolB-like protein
MRAESQVQPVGAKMLYAFEGYALDTDRRELRRGPTVISVQPQVFDLLEYLIRNRDRVVSKDDMLNAVWGGRIVSESTLTSRINAARTAIGDCGQVKRLIKTIPRKGIRFVGIIHEDERPAYGAAAISEAPTLALPDKPSIAVLPFQNIGGDPHDEYFADGVVEDIITALSRFKELFVIARNSTFAYKGRSEDVRRMGRELGVRYLLEGSVRRTARRVRIAGQLVEATTGSHLWADRFDGALEDVFQLQDDITASVVSAIAPRVELAEIERAKRKPTEDLCAYDYYLRGLAAFYRGSKQATSNALHLFEQAFHLDPEFAAAHGMAVWSYVIQSNNGWLVNRTAELDKILSLARRATRLGKDDAIALCSSGVAFAQVFEDLATGTALIDRALALNPNLAAAWHVSGWVRVKLRQPELAIEHFGRAMRLNPLDPFLYSLQNGTAAAHFLAERYDDASSWAEKALREQPNYLPALRMAAASRALAGRLPESRETMARMREIDPMLRVSSLKGLLPFRRPEDAARYEEGLRRAGLPE